MLWACSDLSTAVLDHSKTQATFILFRWSFFLFHESMSSYPPFPLHAISLSFFLFSLLPLSPVEHHFILKAQLQCLYHPVPCNKRVSQRLKNQVALLQRCSIGTWCTAESNWEGEAVELSQAFTADESVMPVPAWWHQYQCCVQLQYDFLKKCELESNATGKKLCAKRKPFEPGIGTLKHQDSLSLQARPVPTWTSFDQIRWWCSKVNGRPSASHLQGFRPCWSSQLQHLSYLWTYVHFWKVLNYIFMHWSCCSNFWNLTLVMFFLSFFFLFLLVLPLELILFSTQWCL